MINDTQTSIFIFSSNIILIIDKQNLKIRLLLLAKMITILKSHQETSLKCVFCKKIIFNKEQVLNLTTRKKPLQIIIFL